ncbi:TPA: helix-turn-helix transcriptional regulator [Salmonella enterica subsp. enterica serovar Reading]|nr:AlpA family phage regulatory protein [Salmonella enterica]
MRKIIVDGIFFYLLSIKTFSQRLTKEHKVSLLELHDVIRRTSLSRATIYRKISKGQFPKQRQISERRVAWHEDDIDKWIESRLAQ